MGTNLFAFIVVLGVLIFFHELGHFLVARLFGVGVEKFSLGFGPRLVGKKVGITDYRISAIPLGGYVKMVGEEPDKEIDPADIPISFTHKSVSRRIFIVAAGPLFNLLLAVLIFWGMFYFTGTSELKLSPAPLVGEVNENSPAQQGGLQEGDLITAIDGQMVDSWDDMAAIITQSEGRALAITIQRGDSTQSVEITPELKNTKDNIFGEEVKRYVIGITRKSEVIEKELSLTESLSEGILRTFYISKLMVVGIVKMIKGDISTDNLGGPIMIAQMAGDQAKVGIGNLLLFIAFISINLAILNFLPIPVLDGGHLLFFFIEAIIRRPVNLRFREVAQQVGIFILVMLMIYVFYNDITRIFSS
jgi:regulator of sigma E protease